MSDTPRTDAFQKEAREDWEAWVLARQLERELNTLKDQLVAEREFYNP